MTWILNRATTRALAVAAVLTVCLTAAVVLVPLQAAADQGSDAVIPTVYRSKWTITVKGKAQSDGVFTMVFKPNQEDAKEFTVRVAAKMNAKKIAEDIWKELSLVAGARYKVKRDDNRIVIRTNSKKDPPCNLQMKQQNLSGVSLLIEG